jgi:Host cell surface-exposed lipoprotein
MNDITQSLPDGSPEWGSPSSPPPQPKPPMWRRPWPVITGAVLVGLTGLVILGGTMAPPTDDVQQPQPTVTGPVPDSTWKTPASTVTTTGAVAAPETTEPPVTKPELTMSQEQAIGKAEDYLDTSHFSRTGLIEQLKFEGYSKADATFAVNYIDVNWKEQAAGKAQDYLDTSHFSRSGLIEQLKFEGFTTAEATYGVNEVGL